jgi:hypothetical protein
MQRLALRGSSISLLVIQPAKNDPARPAKNAYGHQWPRYAYTKAKTIDSQGTQEVVAVLLGNVRLALDHDDYLMWHWDSV